MNNFNVMISKEQIASRIKELGEQITKDYQGKKPIVVCMLKGAVVFFSDLIRNLDIPLTTDFARLSSYRNATIGGNMELVSDLKEDVSNKDVIIVEDIVDSGKTLSYFVKLLKGKNPSSIKICCLLDKPSRREAKIEADYCGFTIPDKFVIGYGLDYAERFRELPFIAEIGSIDELKEDF